MCNCARAARLRTLPHQPEAGRRHEGALLCRRQLAVPCSGDVVRELDGSALLISCKCHPGDYCHSRAKHTTWGCCTPTRRLTAAKASGSCAAQAAAQPACRRGRLRSCGQLPADLGCPLQQAAPQLHHSRHFHSHLAPTTAARPRPAALRPCRTTSRRHKWPRCSTSTVLPLRRALVLPPAALLTHHPSGRAPSSPVTPLTHHPHSKARHRWQSQLRTALHGSAKPLLKVTEVVTVQTMWGPGNSLIKILAWPGSTPPAPPQC